MRFLSILAIAVLGLAMLAGCNSNEQSANSRGASSVPTPADGIRRMTVPELQDLMRQDQVFIVDVRNEDAYNSGHIRGAKLIPLIDTEKRVAEFPKDKLIVTYCT